VQFTVTRPSSPSEVTGMAVVLEESTIATPGAAFFVLEGWNEEVSMSIGKVTIDQRAWASL